MYLRSLIFGVAVCLLMMSAAVVLGQEVTVRGRFLDDSLVIGKPAAFALAVRYPADQNVFLPDSLFTIPGFEYHSRWYAPTRTANGLSSDSAVYRITSFSIDSIQYLTLPAFEVTGTDTTFYQSDTDSVFLKRFVEPLPDTLTATNLPVRSFTDYEDVWMALNVKKLLWAAGIALGIIIIVWIFFGKKLLRAFRQYRLKQSFRRFQDAFAQQLAELGESHHPSKVAALLWHWKEYHQRLERIPYTSLTSKEICGLDEHHELQPALSKIDRMVYSRQADWETQAFQDLRAFSEDRFFRVLEMIKQGKA